MEKVWRVSIQMEFNEIGGNCYVITFANQSDRDRVLDGCPWLYDNYLCVLNMYSTTPTGFLHRKILDPNV